MTLYLDASALAKAYLDERGSVEVRGALDADQDRSIGAVAYAELSATFARSWRDGHLDGASRRALKAALDAQWPRYGIVELDHSLLREAGDVVDRHPKHALRALDAIHLASALRIASGEPTSVTFACWDVRLWRAASDEGFAMLPDTEPA